MDSICIKGITYNLTSNPPLFSNSFLNWVQEIADTVKILQHKLANLVAQSFLEQWAKFLTCAHCSSSLY